MTKLVMKVEMYVYVELTRLPASKDGQSANHQDVSEIQPTNHTRDHQPIMGIHPAKGFNKQPGGIQPRPHIPHTLMQVISEGDNQQTFGHQLYPDPVDSSVESSTIGWVYNQFWNPSRLKIKKYPSEQFFRTSCCAHLRCCSPFFD